MRKLAAPLSPRTQGFMQGLPTRDEEKQLFEQGLSQMAYNVLTSRFPDLLPEVITFRILDTDVDKGVGVGAFVVQHGTDTLYIPVIMSDNQIKPLDMFYHKALNVFLPLNNDWLDEVQQLTLDEMGNDVDTPKSLQRDVDTRHVMVPPTAGRFAYAAARGTGAPDIKADLLQMLTHLQTKTAASVAHLPTFLQRAPEEMRTAFADILLKNTKLASSVSRMYGLDELCAALQKTASATSSTGGGLWVADDTTTPKRLNEIFGDQAPEAFQGVRRDGFAAKDTRKTNNVAVQIQTPTSLQEPADSGFYAVFTDKGQMKPAFVICDPTSVDHHQCFNFTLRGKRHTTTPRLVILNDGKYIRCSRLIGERLEGSDAKKSDLWGKLLEGSRGDTPKVGDHGIFVYKAGQSFKGTKPFTIQTANTDSVGVKRFTCDVYDQTTLIQDPKGVFKSFHQPSQTRIMYIPQTARFIRLVNPRDQERQSEDVLLSDPKAVAELFQGEMVRRAKPLTIKNASGGEFVINKTEHHYGVAKTAEAVARRWDIPFGDALTLVKQAAMYPRAHAKAFILGAQERDFLVRNFNARMKYAQGPAMDPSSMMNGQGAPPPPPPPPGGMPPEGMPPEMMPPPPPPPSPLDMAVGEANTQLQQQMADLQQQQMALESQVQTLQMVQQRAQELAMGGGEAAAMGAPPMPMPGAGGGGMAGGEEMMGGTATMATETPSAAEIQNQVNPQFLEQAAELNDTGVFDAAAISSMSQAPAFKAMVLDYVPVLERSLDNLGRVLLTMWIQESELKQALGEEEYTGLEDSTRNVFEGLGKLILQLNRNTIVLGDLK